MKKTLSFSSMNSTSPCLLLINQISFLSLSENTVKHHGKDQIYKVCKCAMTIALLVGNDYSLYFVNVHTSNYKHPFLLIGIYQYYWESKYKIDYCDPTIKKKIYKYL